jgi:2,3-dihydroxybenzoate-AMP ligase
VHGFVPFPPEFTARYRREGYWADRTLADTLKDACVRYAHRIAVSDGVTDLTYAQIDARAERLALNLLDAGLTPGDIVLLQIGNVIAFVDLYLAFLKIGVRPILALPAHRYMEMKQFVELSGAVATFTADRGKDCDFREIVNQIQIETGLIRHKFVVGDVAEGFLSVADLVARPPTRPASEIAAIQAAIDPCEPALFLLSGGTTAIPKLIPRSHNDYACNSRLAASVTGITDDSVLLLVLPIAHNLPLACPGLQGFLLKGAKVVLHTGTRAETVFPLIHRHRVTHIHLMPALLIRWLNSPLFSAFDLSSLRVLQSGGHRLQPEIRLMAERMLPNCLVQENFGMAEGLLMFVRLDDPRDVRLETVGRPVCEADEVRILDDDDRPVVPGDVGEFCARGPYTLRGYFNAPEYNARAFTADGFYRSGDLMRQHPSGNYVVEGRKKDVINRGGEKISAEEVENLILTHPAVKDVACVAMADPVLGERMCACVILRDGRKVTFEELSRHLMAQRVARFKLPEHLEVFAEFPLSNVGKVSKKHLVQLVHERVTRAAAAAGVTPGGRA